MQVALVGLQQSGKSTLFSALTGEPYDPHTGMVQVEKAIVKVPDERLGVLAAMYKPKKTTYATIEFLDLPGLNFADEPGRKESRRLIAEARQADMLVLTVRSFDNDAVMQYKGRIDPVKDLDDLRSEMLLADMELVSNRIDRLEKSVLKPSKTRDHDKKELALLQRCLSVLEELKPLSEAIEHAEEEKIVRSFGFLTLKPTCTVVNVNEDKIGDLANVTVEDAGGAVISLSATIEAELAALDEEERAAFLEDMGITEIARDRLVAGCYKALDLASFLTTGEDECRAWTIPADCTAVEAAGVIHSDIQRGFIRAETVSYSDLIEYGDIKGAKAAGKVRLEGKTHTVADGDIINFRFNV